MRYMVLSLVYFILISLCIWLAHTKTNRKPEGKIVGGIPVDINRFPSAVQIYVRGDLCAGSILNSWTILTAAHCFDKCKTEDQMVVQVGAQTIHDHFAPSFHVDKVVIHDDYNKKLLFACDIALLFVTKPIKFKKVKKALLVNNDKWMKHNTDNMIVHGWGRTKYGGPVSEKGLLMTHLHFVSSDHCGKMHQLNLTPEMFCLYGGGERDTCHGDSGGAVIWNDMVVGITSHGDGCAKKNKPSIYMNVWYFRKWIKQSIQKYFDTHCWNTDKLIK